MACGSMLAAFCSVTVSFNGSVVSSLICSSSLESEVCRLKPSVRGDSAIVFSSGLTSVDFWLQSAITYKLLQNIYEVFEIDIPPWKDSILHSCSLNLPKNEQDFHFGEAKWMKA
jgi:hypothetical protein